MQPHSSKKHLTPSRKSRPHTSRPSLRRFKANWLDTLDAVNERCLTITTLAGLLEACGEPLEPKLMARTGLLVGREARQIRTLLETAWREAAR
jgi:hypothetical protein